jgi:DNA-binding transcriptional LysR family regulator
MKLPISLKALEVIDAIDRKGSYAAAATVLHKVPSAISYTVQKLEQDLGVTLFQKEGRRAVLTSAGQHLVEQGRLGLGVGYVPENQVTEDLATGRLVALNLAETRADSPLMLGWKASNRGQALQFLLERLRGF